MVSLPPSILSRAISAPALSAHQTTVDGAMEGFLHQATSWKSLTAMAVAGMAYRLGKVGFISLESPLQALAPQAAHLASCGMGLLHETAAFEFAQRLLRPTANSWRLYGPDGLGQGGLSSLVTFGILRGFNEIGRGGNILVQHLLTDLGMVTGHEVLAALSLGPKPAGDLAERMFQAEAVTLHFQAGMGLFHALAPRLSAVEKGLDLGMRDVDTGGIHLPFPPSFAAAISGRTPGPDRSPSPARRSEFSLGLLFMTEKEEKPKSNEATGRVSHIRDLKPGDSPAPTLPPPSEKAESSAPPYDEILQALEATLSVPPSEKASKEEGETSDYIDAFADSPLSSSPASSSPSRSSWESEALGLVMNPPRLPPYVKNLSPVQYQLRHLNTLLEKSLTFDQWRILGSRIEEEMGLKAFLQWGLRSARESPDGHSLLALYRLFSGLLQGPEWAEKNRLILSVLRRMAKYHPEDPVIGKIWRDTFEALPWELSGGGPAALSEALRNLGKAGFPISLVDTLLSQAGQASDPESRSSHRDALHLVAYAAISRNWTASTDPLLLFLEAGYLSQRFMENGDWARAMAVSSKVKAQIAEGGKAAEPLVKVLDRRIETLRPLVNLFSAPSFSAIHQLLRQYRLARPSGAALPPPEAVIRELKRRLPEFPEKRLAIQEGILFFTRETLALLAEALQNALPAEAAKPLLAKMAALQGFYRKPAGDLQREGTPRVVEIAQGLIKLGRYDLVYRIVRSLHALGFVDSQNLQDRILLPILQDLDEVLGGSRRQSLMEQVASIDQGLEAMGPESGGLKGTFLASKSALDALLKRYEDTRVRKNFEDWKSEFTRWLEELY